MTRLAVGFGRGFPRVWLLPIGALTLVLGIAVAGRLSRSIVADLIAWWPVWLGIAIAAYFLRQNKIGYFRAAGVIPLLALLLVGLFTWGHVAGWSVMPSASQRLVGPELGGFTEAAIQAEINGVIEVDGGAEFLYRVDPVRRGGAIGIPGANEQVLDSAVAVLLSPPADPGLYSYAGWDLTLHDTPRWSLVLGGAIDADLTPLIVDELSLAGSGVLRLGATDRETPVSVSGAFRIVVPPDTPARVTGLASVPASWTLDAEGAVAPTFGEGWAITVERDSVVTIVERAPSNQ
ncbi:MAG TPA: hypothetical protein VF148_16840 [Acidimicrobiia bacterium]